MSIRHLSLVVLIFVLNAKAMADPQNDAPTPIKLPPPRANEKAIAKITATIKEVGEDNAAELFAQRARYYAHARQWSKAAADYRRSIELNPSDSKQWMQCGIALLIAKDLMSYQQLTQQMLKQFGARPSIYQGERTAKLCVLPKRPIGMRETIEKLADQAVRDSEDSSWSQYFPSTQALVLYRYGKCDDALKSIAESDRRNAARGYSGDVITMNRLIEAMCRARLGQPDKAKADFEKADKLLRKQLANPNLVIESEFWHDWLICKLLHDEARSVIAATRLSRRR